jgi:P2 family phage contractile tail tube protein
MSTTAVNKLTNGNVYIGGNSHFGKIEEVDAPDIKHKFAEHKGLGLVGTPEYFSGIEKIELKLKLNSVYPDLIKQYANPRIGVSLQIRGSLESWGTGIQAENAYVCFITGKFKNLPAGNFKRQDNVELDVTMAVDAIRVEIGGVEQYAIDVTNNTYRVDGVDILATYRANLGI